VSMVEARCAAASAGCLMATGRLLALLLALVLVVCLERPASALDPQSEDDLQETVVRILIVDELGNTIQSGTGFVVNDQRIVVTSLQVVERASRIVIAHSPYGEPTLHNARILHLDRQKDVAVLEAEGKFLGSPLTLNWADPGGAAVLAAQYPRAPARLSGKDHDMVERDALIPTVGRGSILRLGRSSDIGDMRDIKVVRHSASIGSDNSGAPLLNECGHLVGMNLATFSIQAAELAAILDSLGIRFGIENAACDPNRSKKARDDQSVSAAERNEELIAYQFLLACFDARPCLADRCVSRYQRRAPSMLTFSRGGDIKLRSQQAGDACTRPAVAVVTPPRDAASPPPVSVVPPRGGTVVAPPPGGTVVAPPPGGAVVVPPRLGVVAPPAGAVVPPPGGEKVVVVPRRYYAQLRYEPSPQIDVARGRGDCLDQQAIRIVVEKDYTVTWAIGERSRRSIWRGTVNPYSGEIAIARDRVRITGVDGSSVETPEASVSGPFSNSRIRFGLCGAGQLIVRD
jgi:Trypsin-like peptidase domain